MVLGILTSQPHYEQTYYTEIAKRARLYHNVVAQFTPFCIDPKTDLISGLIYDTDTGKWKEQTFPIPSYIYDRSSLTRKRTSTRQNQLFTHYTTVLPLPF